MAFERLTCGCHSCRIPRLLAKKDHKAYDVPAGCQYVAELPATFTRDTGGPAILVHCHSGNVDDEESPSAARSGRAGAIA